MCSGTRFTLIPYGAACRSIFLSPYRSSGYFLVPPASCRPLPLPAGVPAVAGLPKRINSPVFTLLHTAPKTRPCVFTHLQTPPAPCRMSTRLPSITCELLPQNAGGVPPALTALSAAGVLVDLARKRETTAVSRRWRAKARFPTYASCDIIAPRCLPEGRPRPLATVRKARARRGLWNE